MRTHALLLAFIRRKYRVSYACQRPLDCGSGSNGQPGSGGYAAALEALGVSVFEKVLPNDVEALTHVLERSEPDAVIFDR